MALMRMIVVVCSVSSAGDINGRWTYDDIIIGADRADPNGSNSGESYVVFGKATGYSASLELSVLDWNRWIRHQWQVSGNT